MKKTIMLMVFATVASSAMADVTVHGGSATGATQVQVPFATCTILKEDVTINLSSGNFGSVTCNTVDNIIGVGIASSKGAKKSYKASSRGGIIQEGELAALPTDGASLDAVSAAGAASQ